MEFKKINTKTSIFVLLLLTVSCAKSDRIDIEYQDKYKIEKVYKNNRLISSKTFEDEKLIWHAEYKNGKLQKGIEYYPDQTVKTVSELIKSPNHFYNVLYRKNGKIKSKGESDFFMKDKTFLKRGGTIYYTEDGKISEIMVFEHNDKKEFLIRHTILDTITDTIIVDKIYDPPMTVEEYNANYFISIN